MNLVERAKNTIVTPKTEWEVIKNEQISVSDIFTKYVLILALIPAIATFIGQSLIGISLGPFGYFKIPVSNGLIYLVLYYVLTVVSVYLVALIVDALAPSFGSQKNFLSSLKVVAFSFTASWVAGILLIYPVLGILAIVGSLYGLFLLYMGLKIVKETPPDKLAGYFVIVLIISIVVFVLVGVVVKAIAFSGLMLDNLGLNY